MFDSREGGRLPAIAMPEGDPAAHLAAGTWVRADSLPDLADAIGVPADELVATVERFNGFCQTGVDGTSARRRRVRHVLRRWPGPEQGPHPCDQAPFYAARFVLSDLGTKGGLVTDERGRVLRPDGTHLAGCTPPGTRPRPSSAPSLGAGRSTRLRHGLRVVGGADVEGSVRSTAW